MHDNGPSEELKKDFQAIREKYSPKPEEWLSLDRTSLDKLFYAVLAFRNKFECKHSPSIIQPFFGIKENQEPRLKLKELEILFGSYDCLGLADVFFQNLAQTLDLKLEQTPQDVTLIVNQKNTPNQDIYNMLMEYLNRQFNSALKHKNAFTSLYFNEFEYLIDFAIATDRKYLERNSDIFYKKIYELLKENKTDQTYSYHLFESYIYLRMATHCIHPKIETITLYRKLSGFIETHSISQSIVVNKLKNAKEIKDVIDNIISDLNSAPINFKKLKMLRAILDNKLLSLYFLGAKKTSNSTSDSSKKLFESTTSLDLDIVLKSFEYEKPVELISNIFSKGKSDIFNVFQSDTKKMSLESLKFLDELMTMVASSKKNSDDFISLNGMKYDISNLKEAAKHPQWNSIVARLKSDIAAKSSSSATQAALTNTYNSSQGHKILNSKATMWPGLKYR